MKKLSAMVEGGKRIGHIKAQLPSLIKAGATPLEIDRFVEQEIIKGGDRPSFKMVPGYSHATCVNVNAGIVHGIPDGTPFKPGDVVKVDMGLFHQGYHLDTALTVQIPPQDNKTTEFLKTGQIALKRAIEKAVPGNTVFDISQAIETAVKAAGYSVILDLTGHGVGRELHMEPFIPCFTDPQTKKNVLHEHQTLAIEVMYALGEPYLIEAADGWTLSTQDGSITGMFEETVYIGKDGPQTLTQAN